MRTRILFLLAPMLLAACGPDTDTTSAYRAAEYRTLRECRRDWAPHTCTSEWDDGHLVYLSPLYLNTSKGLHVRSASGKLSPAPRRLKLSGQTLVTPTGQRPTTPTHYNAAGGLSTPRTLKATNAQVRAAEKAAPVNLSKPSPNASAPSSARSSTPAVTRGFGGTSARASVSAGS